MSNKDRYQNTFGKLHLSEDFREKCKTPEESGKGKIMNFRAIHGISRAAAAAITVAIVALGSAGVCYANDIGGIRTTFNMWLNGSRQEVEIVQTGEGTYVVYDENGKETMGFGGMSYDENGNETPISAEELVEFFNNECRLDPTDDGRIIFTYKNLTADVTDLIDENGNLYIHVDDPSNAYTYFNLSDIKTNGAYSAEYGDSPSFGKTYYELDATDLVIDDVPAPELDDNESMTTIVVSD